MPIVVDAKNSLARQIEHNLPQCLETDFPH